MKDKLLKILVKLYRIVSDDRKATYEDIVKRFMKIGKEGEK